MTLQLFIGYTYINEVELDDDAVLNETYLESKKIQLLDECRERINNSKSKPLYFIERTKRSTSSKC